MEGDRELVMDSELERDSHAWRWKVIFRVEG